MKIDIEKIKDGLTGVMSFVLMVLIAGLIFTACKSTKNDSNVLANETVLEGTWLRLSAIDGKKVLWKMGNGKHSNKYGSCNVYVYDYMVRFPDGWKLKITYEE